MKKKTKRPKSSSFLKTLQLFKKRITPSKKKRSKTKKQKGGNLAVLSYKLAQLPRMVKFMKRKK